MKISTPEERELSTKQLNAMRSFAWTIITSPDYRINKSLNLVVVEIDKIRRYRYIGKYVFKNMLEDELLELRDYIFIDELGWRKCDFTKRVFDYVLWRNG
jgi:hypothetical protein